MEARLQQVESFARSQKREITTLREKLADIAEESAVLRECLEATGCLQRDEIKRMMGRRRGAAALSAVLQVPELVRAVGHGAGFRAALAFSETSKGYAQCIQPVLGDLRMLAPAQLCVVGGSCNLRVFARLDLYVLEAFDCITKTWATLPPMPTRRDACAAASVLGKLYVAGGASSGKTLTDRVNNENETRVLNVVERFNTSKRKWETVQPMPTSRLQCAAASLGGCFYVVGGTRTAFDIGGILGVAERFDPQADLWEKLPSMAVPRKACAAAVMNGCLFVVGGHHPGYQIGGMTGQPEAVYNTLEQFDPKKNSWTTMEPMPTRRWACAATSLNGCLYVFGGTPERREGVPLRSLDVVEKFDGFQWTTLPPMPTARSDCSACTIAGQLYVIGGQSERTLGNVERFDPATNTWTTMPSMPTPRQACAAAALFLS